MGKSATILSFLPTKATKPAKKAKARKHAKRGPRDPEVMKKVWATRHANMAKAAKKARRTTKPRSDADAYRDEAQSLLEMTRSSDIGIQTGYGMRAANVEAAKAAQRSESEQTAQDYFAKAARDVLASTTEEAAIQKVQNLCGVARFEGERAADERATKTAKQVTQITTERVVAGFIAEVEHAMTHQGGLPPQQVWTISSYTVCRIVDALNDCGYTAKGRKPQPTRG